MPFVPSSNDCTRRRPSRMTIITAYNSRCALAHGIAGSILQFGMDQQQPQLVRGLRPGQPGRGEAPEVSVLLSNETGDQKIEPRPGAYEHFYRTVAAAALDGEKLAVTPRDACNLMTLLDAARLSATEGRRVDLSQVQLHPLT